MHSLIVCFDRASIEYIKSIILSINNKLDDILYINYKILAHEPEPLIK